MKKCIDRLRKIGTVSIDQGKTPEAFGEENLTMYASRRRGGNINITTQGIYGLKYRERETPLSDITASSQFGVQGEFQLDWLTNVDPSRGLAELPTDVRETVKRFFPYSPFPTPR